MAILSWPVAWLTEQPEGERRCIKRAQCSGRFIRICQFFLNAKISVNCEEGTKQIPLELIKGELN